jgi:hypothetical protein
MSYFQPNPNFENGNRSTTQQIWSANSPNKRSLKSTQSQPIYFPNKSKGQNSTMNSQNQSPDGEYMGPQSLSASPPPIYQLSNTSNSISPVGSYGDSFPLSESMSPNQSASPIFEFDPLNTQSPNNYAPILSTVDFTDNKNKYDSRPFIPYIKKAVPIVRTNKNFMETNNQVVSTPQDNSISLHLRIPMAVYYPKRSYRFNHPLLDPNFNDIVETLYPDKIIIVRNTYQSLENEANMCKNGHLVTPFDKFSNQLCILFLQSLDSNKLIPFGIVENEGSGQSIVNELNYAVPNSKIKWSLQHFLSYNDILTYLGINDNTQPSIDDNLIKPYKRNLNVYPTYVYLPKDTSKNPVINPSLHVLNPDNSNEINGFLISFASYKEAERYVNQMKNYQIENPNIMYEGKVYLIIYSQDNIAHPYFFTDLEDNVYEIVNNVSLFDPKLEWSYLLFDTYDQALEYVYSTFNE